MRAIHLTGNHITEEVTDFLIKRTHAKKIESQNVIPIGNMPTNLEFRGEKPKEEQSPFLRRILKEKLIKAQLKRAIKKQFRPKPDQKAIRAREAQ